MSKNKKLLLIYVFTLTIFPLILSGILNVIPVITEERGLVFVNLSVYAIFVRRHIVGGANRTLISAITSLRSCGIGTCRRLSSG